jgi:hypothetical protein
MVLLLNAPERTKFLETKLLIALLQLFKKLASRAGNENPTRNSALPILHPLHNACRFPTLGAISALGGVHYLLTVCRFSDLRHRNLLTRILPQPEAAANRSSGIAVERLVSRDETCPTVSGSRGSDLR